MTNPLVPPRNPTLDNYRLVLGSDFVRYFMNTVIVTVGAVVPAVAVSFMAAYAIIRDHRRWFLRGTNSMFLMGLAIPLQAAIIPVNLMIIKLKLYDTLLAMILPSIALPSRRPCSSSRTSSVTSPPEFFDSMRVDGATEWAMPWRLAFPLTSPALLTVTIYNALTIWNEFLLPLDLTQTPNKRTLPLALWTFQGQYSVNVPARPRVGIPHRAAHPAAIHRRSPTNGHRLSAGFSK